MARNIKYRKKEVKEARDLMGLAALVLASKEIEQEMQKLSQTKNSQPSSGKWKNQIRSSSRIKHNNTITQTSLSKSKKDGDSDNQICVGNRKSQKSTRTKSRSPSPTKKINKKIKTQELLANKLKRMQKRNRSNDADEEELKERKNITPKKKKGSNIFRKNVNNDITTGLLYAKFLLSTTFPAHKKPLKARIQKRSNDVRGIKYNSDSFSCDSYIEKKVRIIIDNKIFNYTSNKTIIKHNESRTNFDKVCTLFTIFRF